MVFALTPVQSAFATHGDDDARDINEAGDVCEGRNNDEFDDIANEDTDDAAECLNDLGIASGFVDGTYRPTIAITREQMASFLARKMMAADQFETDESYPEADYTDREQIAEAHIANVDLITAEGVGEGFEDGRYGPAESVTRGQMASFIIREMEVITGEEITATEDHFDDDDGTFHEDNINALAELGIAEGDANGDYNPHASVTRGQMALFIARNVDALNDVYGITFTSIREEEPTPTNQTFDVTPSGDQTVETFDSVDFTATEITSDTVDILLLACEDVTIGDDGNVVFADADNDGEADFNTNDTAAVITDVNDVAGAFGDHVDEATVTDGTVTFTVETRADECVVAVVFNDADDDDALDVDADGLPTEEFAIGAFLTSDTVAALDATPESEVNRFGTDHTITATLEDSAGNTVALDGESIRFQVYRGAGCNPGSNATPSGTVVATGSDTTEDGVATFTYTLADPSTANDPDTTDCILVFWDENNDAVNNDTHQDVVSKTWSDDLAAANTLTLEPETDSNLVGTQHTVTATVTDQFGDPIDTSVRFEVYRNIDTGTNQAQTPILTATRTTGTDGEVTFTYTGPATQADDLIVACTDPSNDTCEVAVAGNQVVVNDEGLWDTAQKFWVERVTADRVDEGDVVGFDTAADFVDIESEADRANRRFAYDSGDRFFIVCGGNNAEAGDITVNNLATMAEFEEALTVGEDLFVDFDQDGQSEFVIADEDQSSSFCP